MLQHNHEFSPTVFFCVNPLSTGPHVLGDKIPLEVLVWNTFSSNSERGKEPQSSFNSESVSAQTCCIGTSYCSTRSPKWCRSLRWLKCKECFSHGPGAPRPCPPYLWPPHARRRRDVPAYATSMDSRFRFIAVVYRVHFIIHFSTSIEVVTRGLMVLSCGGDWGGSFHYFSYPVP